MPVFEVMLEKKQFITVQVEDASKVAAMDKAQKAAKDADVWKWSTADTEVESIAELEENEEASEVLSGKPFVVVRTVSAGVHMGYLESHDGQQVTLSHARRLWKWNAANTLNEVSQKGVDMKNGTRISEPAPLIVLTQAIEIITCSEAARENLQVSRWL